MKRASLGFVFRDGIESDMKLVRQGNQLGLSRVKRSGRVTPSHSAHSHRASPGMRVS